MYSAGGVRCPQRQRRRRQRQRVTEGTAMAPWNGPNKARFKYDMFTHKLESA